MRNALHPKTSSYIAKSRLWSQLFVMTSNAEAFDDGFNSQLSEKKWLFKYRRLKSICSMVICVFMLVAFPDYAYAEQSGIGLSITQAPIDAQTLHIGDSIQRQFEIAASNTECYVRVTLDLESSGIGIDDAYSAPEESGWIRCGDGKWYFPSPIKAGGSISYTANMHLSGRGIYVVEKSENTDVHLKETITAEAVGANALCPDWTLSDPWHVVSNVEMSDITTDFNNGSDTSHTDLDSTCFIETADRLEPFIGAASGIHTSAFQLAQTGDMPILVVIMCLIAVSIAALLGINTVHRGNKRCKEGYMDESRNLRIEG